MYFNQILEKIHGLMGWQTGWAVVAALKSTHHPAKENTTRHVCPWFGVA